MSFASKLMNPTPWPVKFDYSSGIVIRIEPFGEFNLSMEQMGDFMPGKPGSEAVSELVDVLGVFLYDADRPYDHQALEALKRCRKVLNDRAVDGERTLRGRRSAEGVNPDEAAVQATLNKMGVTSLKNKVQILDDQIAKYETVIGNADRKAKPKLDPARTVFVTNPPRQFPSVAAMNFFLEQNPDIKAKHDALTQRQTAPAEVTETV